MLKVVQFALLDLLDEASPVGEENHIHSWFEEDLY